MLADLLDQRTPFGRLSLVQVFMTAGDTLLTVSLAGSLFFSISPKAAESKVLLYLVLTMAPFAVVAPFLGPVIDRSRGIRRLVVVASAASRAAVCLVMAGKLHSLLLFPLAFVMLVLSKVYLVTKGSIVPLYAATATGGADPAAGREAMATLNARLGLLASLAGFAASLPAIAVLKLLVAAGCCGSTSSCSPLARSPVCDFPCSGGRAKTAPGHPLRGPTRAKPGPPQGLWLPWAAASRPMPR